MSNIYMINPENSLIFYPNEHQIILRYKNAETIGRQIILANNYAYGLDDIFYHGMIFYVYISTQNHLILRNTKSVTPIYQIDYVMPPNSVASSPQLCFFNGQLLLFYFLADERTGAFRMHCDFPFQPSQNTVFPDVFKEDSLHFTLQLCGDLLYLMIHTICYRMDSSFQISAIQEITPELVKEQKALQERIIAYESTIQQLQNQNFILTDEINKYKTMVESATQQYNELMYVAEKYRDESIKWRNKFYH